MNIESLSSKGQRSRSQQHRAPFYQQTSQNSLTDCRMNLKLVGNIRGIYTFKHYNCTLVRLPTESTWNPSLAQISEGSKLLLTAVNFCFTTLHRSAVSVSDLHVQWPCACPHPAAHRETRCATVEEVLALTYDLDQFQHLVCRRKMFFDSFTSPCIPYAPSTAGATGPYNSALVSVYRYANLFHTSRRCNMRNCWVRYVAVAELITRCHEYRNGR